MLSIASLRATRAASTLVMAAVCPSAIFTTVECRSFSQHGALGAKLTGGGGGGSMLALCPQHAERVLQALRSAGYQALSTQIG
jgi:mevalonate kinase